jgi:hypothetical protein
MRKLFISLLLLVVVFAQPLFAQNNNAGWEKWQTLIGEWKGEGNGQPGQGSGTFSFHPQLGGNVLIRKSHTEFPASGNRPASSHEDLMVVYKNQEGSPVKAIYFDNESHVIRYNITYADRKIVLTSEPNPAAPRFRLVYELLEDSLVNIRFEMAMPNAPEEFKLYLEGRSRKN